MRIVHVINDLRGGGAQNLVFSLASSQCKHKHDVQIIAIHQQTTDYERNMEVKLFNSFVKVHNLGYKPNHGYIGWIRSAIRLFALFKELKPDIINSHLEMSHSITALAFLFLPQSSRRVATVHNAPETWGRTPFIKFLTRPLFWSFLNYSTPRIYCSDAARAYENNWKGQYITIPNGVSPPSIPMQLQEKRAAFRREMGIPNNAFIVVSVGTAREEKNHITAIRAIAVLHNMLPQPVHYVICGARGTGSAALDDVIKETGLSKYVHLLGLRQDSREILFYSDCYLSASLREGLPLAVLEALFAGLPCVLSAIKPHCDLALGIPDCFIVENNPIPLAESIRHVVLNGCNSSAMRSQREPLLHNSTIEVCASRYLHFYESLLFDIPRSSRNFSKS